MKNIFKIISTYPAVKNREPLKLSELRLFINKDSDQKNLASSSAVRNVFLSDYYKFKYINFKNNVYLPKELSGDFNKIIKKYVNNNFELFSYSLAYELGLSTQKYNKTSYIIFTNPILELEKWIVAYGNVEITYLNLSKDKVENFILLYKLKLITCFGGETMALDFLKNNNLFEQSKLIKLYDMYMSLIENVFHAKEISNSTWNITSANSILEGPVEGLNTLGHNWMESIIMKAIHYAK